MINHNGKNPDKEARIKMKIRSINYSTFASDIIQGYLMTIFYPHVSRNNESSYVDKYPNELTQCNENVIEKNI